MQPDLLAKKIKENLISQREKLQFYLKVLESENKDIMEEDVDKLIEHIQLEKNIIDELNNFKKILIPLEKIYNSSPYLKDNTIINLKKGIEDLANEVNKQSSKNKESFEILKEKINIQIKNKEKINFIKSSYSFVDSKFVDINI